MRLKAFLGVVLLGICAIAVCGFAATPEEDEAAARAKVKNNLGKATVTLVEAVRSALVKFPGGHAVETAFEVEGDALEFFVLVIADGKRHDISIDAKTGKILAVEDGEDGPPEVKKLTDAATKAKVTLRQAVETAQKQVTRGKAYDAYPDMDGETLVYLVGLLTTDKFVAVEVDATTGKVLGMEEQNINAK